MNDRTRARRRMYTGGALMVLAPIGVASCGGSTSTEEKVAPQDASVDETAAPADAKPEAVAVGPVDALPPDALAIAPVDAIAVAPADAIAVAPVDAIAVAPADGPMVISPVDDASMEAGSDGSKGDGSVLDSSKEGGQGDTCQVDDDCQNTLFCEQQICIVACDPQCAPLPCGPGNPPCPGGSTCEAVGSGNQCVRH